MRLIVCNVALFSGDQYIQVYDTDEQIAIFAQKVSVDDVPAMVCALAKKFETKEVRFSGAHTYIYPLVEETKTAYALNYGQNDLNVEVI